MQSIEIPIATFSQYLEKLVDRCNNVDTLEEAKELQKEIDEIIALKDAVQAARVEMNRRVTQAL